MFRLRVALLLLARYGRRRRYAPYGRPVRIIVRA